MKKFLPFIYGMISVIILLYILPLITLKFYNSYISNALDTNFNDLGTLIEPIMTLSKEQDDAMRFLKSISRVQGSMPLIPTIVSLILLFLGSLLTKKTAFSKFFALGFFSGTVVLMFLYIFGIVSI